MAAQDVGCSCRDLAGLGGLGKIQPTMTVLCYTPCVPTTSLTRC